MKQIIFTAAILAGLSAPLFAQEEKSDKGAAEKKDNYTLTVGKKDTTKDGGFIALGSGGLKVTSKRLDSINQARRVSVHFLTLDLGINALHDQTDYSNPAAQQYFKGAWAETSGDVFSLRQAKSINVNIWPVLFDFRLFKSSNQKISLYTGAGMQLYNFKFSRNISYITEPTVGVISDTVKFSKNKLAFAYVSIPLMLKFKTRLGGNFWITYGAGVIGGYCFDSWTKQISDERGKQKNHDQFNFQKFNLNLSGEIGINGYIRFYGTYQVTNMYENGLNQHPYCIGIRFFGV